MTMLLPGGRSIFIAVLSLLIGGCGARSGVRDSGSTEAASPPPGAGGIVGSGGAQGSGGIAGVGGMVGLDGAAGAMDTAPPDAGSSLIDRVDGAEDAAALDAPAADAAGDVASPCGDAACRGGQACALIGGGPVPLCEPAVDAGTCREGLVLVASCSVGGGPEHWAPGCTTPPETPHCYDYPDGCGDFCSCICGVPENRGCFFGPGYFICGRP